MPRESESPTRDGQTSARGADKPLRRGTLLGGRYRIDAVLGSGGMGVVYRARDLKLDLDIALKRIRPDRMSPERQETLRREIILSRKVTHENVCRVFDLVEMDGEGFVSMEYLPGKTLKDIENDEKVLPLGRGLAIAKKICRGLAAAHRIGVLHRDLKPENVVVSEDGTPRLMDFGIAVDSAAYRGEKGDAVPGTPQFLAPELLRGEAPSVRTDLYAMGVLLYEMFTGHCPIDDTDTARLVRRIVSETPPSAANFRPDLPPELLALLDRAIASDPEARFPDADSLADAIGSFEGAVLDRVLAEVSVTRAKMVKLMVILEANKSLAATVDPTETLKIILKTATSETDAERGTIFLREPGTDQFASQILEGGSIAPIRVSVGRGIAGTVGKTGETINIPDAYGDPRFDPASDTASGFQTRSLLASPMTTPRGEIVGVVELINKRRGTFTKEDEEFLAEVGTHAALAVEGVRQHEAAVASARREGEAAAVRAAAALLEPSPWPATPGFDSAKLRVADASCAEPALLSCAAAPAAGRLCLLLLEASQPGAEGLASLARALEAGREGLSSSSPAELVASIRTASPACAAAAARWNGESLELAATGMPLPRDLGGGQAPAAGEAAGDAARAERVAGETDLVLLASSRLAPLEAQAVERLRRTAAARGVAAALEELASAAKARGDLLLLAARRA